MPEIHDPNPQTPSFKVGLIGAGNLAWNLAMSLRGSLWHPIQVISRTPSKAEEFAKECDIRHHGSKPEDLIQDLDLVIICSTDHVIANIAAEYAPFRGPKTIFVHTAGSVPLSALSHLHPNIGVFYPLQTFTKGHLVDFRPVPIFLEGEKEAIAMMRPMANHLSDEVRELDSEGRLRIHLGAVFASNFANYMWVMAEDILHEKSDFNLQVYRPLVMECVQKAFKYGPEKAQTGPAKRGDDLTLNKHLSMLNGENEQWADLYARLSVLIRERFQQP